MIGTYVDVANGRPVQQSKQNRTSMVGLSSDSDVISHALFMWANYIQTGGVVTSALTAHNCGYGDCVKVLTDDQMEFVLRLKKLSTKKGWRCDGQ